MRALVVDDAKAMRSILSGMVQALGFEAFDAEDGQDALQILKSIGAIDLILVDWNMPNMNGLEFVKAIREIDVYADTKIMMVSMETGMDHVNEALDAGADEYVMKPFTKEAIAEKLALLDLINV